MSKAQLLRAFWLPGLYQVTGQLTTGLAAWIGDDSHYSVSRAPAPNHFSVDVLAPVTLAMAYAYDAGRMAGAAFESMVAVTRVPALPRSMGWFVIKTYYAAFFAGQSLSRLFGTSFSQLTAIETKVVKTKAAQLGVAVPQSITAGNYTCVYEAVQQRLSCTLNSNAGGIHISFWNAFGKILDDVAARVLALTTETTANKQPVYSKLIELRDIVSTGWLSEVRNEVNYKQLLGCWYPYKGMSRKEQESLERRLQWNVDPMTITLTPNSSDLSSFLSACCFVVALCRSLTADMAARCPGKSFLEYQSEPVLRLAGTPLHA